VCAHGGDARDLVETSGSLVCSKCGLELRHNIPRDPTEVYDSDTKMTNKHWCESNGPLSSTYVTLKGVGMRWLALAPALLRVSNGRQTDDANGGVTMVRRARDKNAAKAIFHEWQHLACHPRSVADSAERHFNTYRDSLCAINFVEAVIAAGLCAQPSTRRAPWQRCRAVVRAVFGKSGAETLSPQESAKVHAIVRARTRTPKLQLLDGTCLDVCGVPHACFLSPQHGICLRPGPTLLRFRGTCTFSGSVLEIRARSQRGLVVSRESVALVRPGPFRICLALRSPAVELEIRCLSRRRRDAPMPGTVPKMRRVVLASTVVPLTAVVRASAPTWSLQMMAWFPTLDITPGCGKAFGTPCEQRLHVCRPLDRLKRPPPEMVSGFKKRARI
jgi:hypothetical protein